MHRIGSVAAVHNQLGQERVVRGPHFAASFNPSVYTHVTGQDDLGQHTCSGLEVVVGIFGIYTRLDGVAFRGDFKGREVWQVTAGQLDHPLDNVHACDRLGHTVLDLQASIDLEKVEVLCALIDHKFNGTRRAVIHRLGQPLCSGMKCLAHLGTKVWCRGFFHHLLVSSLK